MQQNSVTAPIIGVRTLEQLNENIQALDIQLSNEQMERLTKASATPLPYPFDFLQRVKLRDNL